MSTMAPVATSANPLKEQLDRDGFVRVPGVIDPVTIDTLLLRAQATLFRATQAERDAVKSTGSLIHLSDHPEYADIIGYPPLIALLRTLDASDPRWTGGFLISKPAGGPPLFWHQDWWGWTEPESYAVRPQQWFAMIYLTDTTPENGCLRVIPGTHRRDHPLHHLEAAHSEALQRFQNPDDPVYGSHPDEVAVPVRAGDVLIGDARLIHGAYGNRTARGTPVAHAVVHAALERHVAGHACTGDARLPARRRHPHARASADAARLDAGIAAAHRGDPADRRGQGRADPVATHPRRGAVFRVRVDQHAFSSLVMTSHSAVGSPA